MDHYEVVVIGAGPGGYVAAIRCAQLGLNTACVDSWLDADGQPAPGGTCLNIGCIPSKALLDSSHHYHWIKEQAGEHGIHAPGVTLDVHRMIGRKDAIVKTLTRGIGGLFRKNGVTYLPGHARLQADRVVDITPVNGDTREPYSVQAENIIIATGSVPATIPAARIDHDRIVDSTGALAFTDVPKRLGIIGAGVIGLELGSVWKRLGSQVILLEALDELLPPLDRQLAAEAGKLLARQGLDIRLGARVTGSGSNNREVTVTYEDRDGKHQITVDRLVVAVGRKPRTEGLGAAAAGLSLDGRGAIEVDAQCRTGQPGIYAIGDVVRGPMLAHKASEEGIAVAESIAGQPFHMNYATIPWVIYTWPEIAWVGSTEQELRTAGTEYRCGVFPFAASGRARAMGEIGGMVKVLAASRGDRVLGVHILGPNASELICEAVVAMEFDASAEDIARTIHAHPTLTEALHEAALGVDGRSLHV